MMMVFLVLMVLMVELLLPDWYQPVACLLSSLLSPVIKL